MSIINISGVVTDGALATAGKGEGLAKLIEDDAVAAPNSRVMRYYYLAQHQENVCTKALKMNNATQIFTQTANFTRAKD